MIRALAVLGLSVVAGCTETIQLTNDPLANLVAIDLVPGDATVTLRDLSPPHHTLQYTAMGRLSDGSSLDISDQVEWSIDNTLLGAFDSKGLFTASHRAAGYGAPIVRGRGLEASGTLTVVIDAAIVDAAFPPPAPNLFPPGAPTVTGSPNAPKLAYPADGTLFPQGVASTLFQFARGTGNDAVKLVFESPVLHLTVETGGDRWLASSELQQVLAGSGLAAPIRTDVLATSSTGTGAIYQGAPVQLAYGHDAPTAPLYFWSAATNGIMRGGIDAPTASKLYPSSGTCVGCHSISRNGRAMAMGVDNNAITVDLQTIDLTSLATEIPATPGRQVGWSTYSPDATRLLLAHNGALTLLDGRTGAPIGPDGGRVPIPAGKYATHPDWSPDGSYVAIALTNQTPNNLDVKAASIARIPYNGGSWGPVETLVVGSSTSNNYFPRYSPTGSHLAYVHATGSSQGAASAELMVVAAEGGTPVRLVRASSRVGIANVVDLSNTMPTWWPQRGEREWIAFVSSRPYGSVLPGGRGQIWITSLDLSAPSDPSSAAFWLPCQDVTVLNNNPAWANESVSVRPAP